MRNRSFLYALSTLVGMIIGVGIFGIPYSFAQAGAAMGFFYLVLLTAAVLTVHLFYGEIVLRTHGSCRLVGYAEKYLGAFGKKITAAVVFFQFYGALLVYLIAGGNFLRIIFGDFFGGNELIWTLIFFGFGALLLLFGIRALGFSELLLTSFLLVALIIILIKAGGLVEVKNIAFFNLDNFFLPYGVILFSLAGGAAIPELRQILKGQERQIKKVIILGTLIPAVLYLFFAFCIVGVSGGNTAPNAIDGLANYFGRDIVVLGAIFGFLAVFTSFLVLGANLQKVFNFDYKLPRLLSWFLACFVPLGAWFLGLNNFILVIGLVGALAGGGEGIIIVLTYLKAKRAGDRQSEYNIGGGKALAAALILVFALGAIYQFIYLGQ